MTQILPETPLRVGPATYLQIRAVVVLGRMMCRWRPHVLRRTLTAISRGASPAHYDGTRLARDQILTSSAVCRGGTACLLRSISVALLCRARGTWPIWSVGVLAVPPFAAHAWVEADGRIVDEPLGESDYRAFFKVTGSNTSTGRPTREGKEV